MSEYTEQGEKFLKDHGLEFRAVLVGNACPQFCEDAAKDKDMDKVDSYPRKSHIHGKHYRCTISGVGRGHVSFDYWNCYADEAHNALDIYDRPRNDRRLRKVSAYDLLTCIEKNHPGTFENFCGDMGMDTDSRKAESIYHAVVREFNKVQKFFTPAELEELAEIN